MIKGIIIGAIGMYIYLVQPEWASGIVEYTTDLYDSIIDNIQHGAQLTAQSSVFFNHIIKCLVSHVNVFINQNIFSSYSGNFTLAQMLNAVPT